MFICVHSFSVSGKKNTRKKSETKNLCVEVYWGGDAGGGGVGDTPTKKRMITDFYFQDLEFSELGLILQNTTQNLFLFHESCGFVVDFYSFSGFKKKINVNHMII